MATAFPSFIYTQGQTLVDESGTVFPPLLGLVVETGTASARTQTEFDTMYSLLGARVVRQIVYWDHIETTQGVVNQSYLTNLDNNIARATAAAGEGMYSWLGFYFGPANANRVPAWAGTGSALSIYIAHGQFITQFLANRYGNPSSAKYNKAVFGWGINEPTPDDTNPPGWAVTSVSQQAQAITWARAAAGAGANCPWILFFNAGFGSDGDYANAPGSGHPNPGPDQSGTTSVPKQPVTPPAGRSAGGYMVDHHNYNWVEDFTQAQPWDGRSNVMSSGAHNLQRQEFNGDGYPPPGYTANDIAVMGQAYLATYLAYCDPSWANCPLFIGENGWDAQLNPSGGDNFANDKANLYQNNTPPFVGFTEWAYSTSQSSEALATTPGAGAAGAVGGTGPWANWLLFTKTFFTNPNWPTGGTTGTTKNGTARITGTGTLTARSVGVEIATISGSGTLTAGAFGGVLAPLHGAGALTAQGFSIPSSPAGTPVEDETSAAILDEGGQPVLDEGDVGALPLTISGTGILTAHPSTGNPSATINGQGVLSAAVTSSPVQQAVLAGTGTLTASAVNSAALSGTGSLTAYGNASAQLVGTGAMVSLAVSSALGFANLAGGDGTTVVTALTGALQSGMLAGTGILAAPHVVQQSPAPLSGTGTMTALTSGFFIKQGTAPLFGLGAFSAVSKSNLQGAAPLTGVGALSASWFSVRTTFGGMLSSLPGRMGDLSSPAQPAPSPPGGAYWQVRVSAAPDYSTLLAVVPRYTTLTFTKQLNDKGSGTVTIDLDDTAFWGQTLANGQPGITLFDQENLVQVYQDGNLVFDFLAETVTEDYLESTEQRVITVTGPGTIATLGWGAAMPPGFPNVVFKTDAIQDSFSETDENGNLALDTGIWNLIFPANHVTINPSGTMQLTASPNTTFAGTTLWDITNSSISAQVVPIVDQGLIQSPPAPAQLNGSQVSQMYVQQPGSVQNYALIGLSRTLFYVQIGDSGHAITHTIGAYDPTAHAYWRISEAKGIFYFWTSPDGLTWVLQFQHTYSWNASKIDVVFAARYSVDNSQIMGVLNLNSDVTNPQLAGTNYFGLPVMGIWFTLLQECQARGTIPFITSRASATKDSFGHPWTDVNSVQIQNGTDLFTMLQTCAGIVNADWCMQPGFVLEVGLPTTDDITLGTDRSEQIVLREAQAELTKQRVRARDKIANLVAGVNSDGVVAVDEDPASINLWGQREQWVQAGTQVDPLSLDGMTAASLLETSDEVLSWTMTIVPDLAGAAPFKDFDVGDWVGAEQPGNNSVIDVVRVVAIAISIDPDGVVSCEPTLNSYRQWVQEQLAYVVNKLGGNFVNALGATVINNPSGGAPAVQIAPQLGGLANVVTGTINMDPLVYNAVSGLWQPASLADSVSGLPLGIAVGVPGGESIQISPNGSGVNIVITDSDGVTRVISGQQSDGSYGTVPYNAGPPGQPDLPIVATGILGLYVGWDGLMSDGSTPLTDFSYVEVHVSSIGGFTPSAASLQGHILPGGVFGVGSLTAGTTYYVKLVAVNASGVAGPPSAQVAGVPEAVSDNIAPGSITGQQVMTGTLTTQQISQNAGISGGQLAADAGIVAGQVVFSATDIGGISATFDVSPPQDPGPNTLWYDTANGNTLKTWNGTTWVPAQFGVDAVSFSASDIGGLTVSFGGQPVNPSVGALWYDSANGYLLKQWNGTTWVPYMLGAGAVSFSASDIGGISVTIAASPPPNPSLDALWYNSAAGFVLSQWTGSTWNPYQFGTQAIQAGSVTAALIAANTITAAQIATGTITASQIASGTITATQIAAGTITGTNIAAGTITGNLISANSITANQIAASTITSAQIAAGTITSTNIAAGSISADNIATGTLSAALMAAGIVVAGIVDGTVITGTTIIADGSSGQVLVYNGPPSNGNLIFSVSGAPGYDSFGNFYPLGLGLNQGTLTGVGLQNSTLTGGTVSDGSVDSSTVTNSTWTGGTITETVITFDTTGGALLLYATTTTLTTQTTSGTYEFTVPTNTPSVDTALTGAGAGASGGSATAGGHGGGGGEWARNPTYSVEPGAVITYTVGDGGAGTLTGQGVGQDGGDTVFDGGGVVANGGLGTGIGGSGSTAPLENPGGNGVAVGAHTGGSGGGGAGGPSGAGGNSPVPSGATGTTGGNGGAGGGGPGGHGGNAGANGSAGVSPGGGGGGPGTGSVAGVFNKTYVCQNSHSYEGSGGAQPNTKINDNGVGYQCGDLTHTTYGHAFTFFAFEVGQMVPDLSGVTITSFTVTFNNLHTWYSSGMTVALGVATQENFPGSVADPTGAGVDMVEFHMDESTVATFDLTNQGFGTAFKTGGANCLLVYKNTSDLHYYGYFAGASFARPPKITITGTTGSSAAFQGGGGADGQSIVTVASGATLVAAISPVAGTDAMGNTYPAGIWLGDTAAPAAQASGSALFSSGGQLGYVSATPDGNTYLTGRLTLVSSGPQTVNATGYTAISGLTAPQGVGIDTYHVRGQVYFTPNQNAGSALLKFASNATFTNFKVVFYELLGIPAVNTSITSTPPIGNIAQISQTGPWQSAGFGSTDRLVVFDGWFATSAGGTFSLEAACTTAADTWTIQQSGTYMELFPV